MIRRRVAPFALLLVAMTAIVRAQQPELTVTVPEEGKIVKGGATAPRPPGAPQVKIDTLAGTKTVDAIKSLENGKLVVAGATPAEIPLDQVLAVQWQNDDSLAVLWIGQDRWADGHEVPDMHVRLRGLRSGKGIRDVNVSGPWRPPGSRKPEVKRAAGATVADLYYEPPEQDDFSKKHYLTVTYDDGSSSRVLFECTSHTSKQATAAKSDAVRMVVYDTQGSRLTGALLGMDEHAVRLRSGWNAELKIPRSAIAAYSLPERALRAATKEFEKQRIKPSAEDVALVLARDVDPAGKPTQPSQDTSVHEVAGKLLGIADGKLQFRYEGENRTIALQRVIGVIIGKPAPQKTTGPKQSFELANGDVLVGAWQGLTPQDVRVAAWGSTLPVPRKWIDAITFRNGKLTYLSDLTPAKAEQTAYFDREWPYRRDRSLTGAPLLMAGVQYAKGLAVHSRTVLTYSLDAPCERFQALVGFDDQAGRSGRAACRVLGDGKLLWKADDLRATEPPKQVDLAIAGVQTLVLEVDFGQDADVGDRVIWADARLLREAAP